MTTNKLMRISLIVLSVTILIGVGLMIALLVPKEENIIRIDLDNGEDTAIECGQLNLSPGEKCTYTLLLTAPTTDEYDLTLSFTETEDSPLKEYVYVKISDGSETLCDRLLSEVLDGESIATTCKVTKKQAYPIVVTYYLPQDVGNEAQNAEAFFDLHVHASNE